MIIKSNINLKLNWKKTNTVFSFSQNSEKEIPEDVAIYLLSAYPGKFSTIKQIFNIPETKIAQSMIPIEKKQVENGLYELLQLKDVKEVIEKALEEEIIQKNGMNYFYGNKFIAKGIKKLKEKLEEDESLFSEIKLKCQRK